MKKVCMTILISMITLNSWALYYGTPVNIAGDNIGGVEIKQGDTPFPTNSVYPVAFELRSLPSRYLKVVNNTLVEKSILEKAFADLPIKYKKQVDGLWVEMSAQEKHMVDLPDKYKNPDGSEMTEEQKKAVDDAEAAAAEAARQAAKPLTVKTLENQFLTMCDVLTSTTTHTKLGFDALETLINNIPDQNVKIETSLKLLKLDAALKREAGLLWWDTCAWHSDIVQ